MGGSKEWKRLPGEGNGSAGSSWSIEIFKKGCDKVVEETPQKRANGEKGPFGGVDFLYRISRDTTTFLPPIPEVQPD